LAYIGLVESNVSVALEFGRGAFGDEEKLAEFFVGLPTKTFGDVGHDRNGGTAYLIF